MQGRRGKSAIVEAVKYASLPNDEVFKCWRLAPTALELVVRCLKYYQDVAQWSDMRTQELAALFGQAKCDKFPPVDCDGRHNTHASLWLTQMATDMQRLGNTEMGHDWYGRLDGRWLLILIDDEFKTEFLSFDGTYLRQAAYTCAIPPPGFEALPLVHNGSATTPEETPFVCDESAVPDPCYARIATARGLSTHARFFHGRRETAWQRTVTNQCPFCMSIFC